MPNFLVNLRNFLTRKKPSLIDQYLTMADTIIKFVDSSPDLGEWDWDDLITIRKRDDYLESIRIKILKIGYNNPPTKGSGSWCSKKGLIETRELANQILERVRNISE